MQTSTQSLFGSMEYHYFMNGQIGRDVTRDATAEEFAAALIEYADSLDAKADRILSQEAKTRPSKRKTRAIDEAKRARYFATAARESAMEPRPVRNGEHIRIG